MASAALRTGRLDDVGHELSHVVVGFVHDELALRAVAVLQQVLDRAQLGGRPEVARVVAQAVDEPARERGGGGGGGRGAGGGAPSSRRARATAGRRARRRGRRAPRAICSRRASAKGRRRAPPPSRSARTARGPWPG